MSGCAVGGESRKKWALTDFQYCANALLTRSTHNRIRTDGGNWPHWRPIRALQWHALRRPESK